MRGFFRFLFGLIFVLVTIFLVTIFTLKTTVLNRDYLLEKLTKNDIYTKVYRVIPEFTKTLVSQAEKGELGEGEAPPLSGEQIGTIITDSVTPSVLKEKTELFITGFYGWLYGEGPAIPEISLSDIKPKLETYAAAQMNVPLDVIGSEGSNFKVPEKIQIKPVPLLTLLRSIYANYNIAFYVSLFISLISLVAVVLLSEDWAKRVSRPGTPIIITGTLLAINAGFIWIFFNAGNMLYKQVADALRGSPGSVNVAYGFLSGIVNDISIRMLIFSGVLVFLGIILKIVGHVLKKKLVDK